MAHSVSVPDVSIDWILLDCNGRVSDLGDDKNEIMERIGIHARDLRIFDPTLSCPSAILGREKLIVLNLEYIQAIITAKEALFRGSKDDDVIRTVQQLKGRLLQETVTVRGKEVGGHETSICKEFPFEFVALEVVLEAICSLFDARATELETDTHPVLNQLTFKISSRNLDRVRTQKSAMTRLTNRVQKVRDELENLLKNGDDMADLCLSRNLSRKMDVSCSSLTPASATTFQAENGVKELKMLLGAYFIRIDGTLNKLNTLREYIDDTEDYINIRLDNQRNQLIQLDFVLSSWTMCLTVCSVVGAIFGMNIPYSWNKGHDYMFKWVIICTGIVCVVLFLLILSFARWKRLLGS